MSSRQRGTSRSRNPQPQTNLRPYLLPALGVAAILLMVGLIVVILASSGDDNGGNDDSVVADADETPEATAPSDDEDEDDEQALAPTPTPDTGDDAAPDPTPTEPAEPEEEQEPTPEPTPTPEPEPTPPPMVGDFGELPSGDMPSGSPADSLNLEYRLDMSLQSLPAEAPVYEIQRRAWSAEGVQELANRLGIQGEVVDQGNGSFQVDGETASLYISSTVVQYVQSAAPNPGPPLPGDDELAQMARNWLTQNGLTGADTGPGQVLDRDEETGRAYVQVKPVEPQNLISATPSAGITILGDGTVTEAMINWPEALQASNYGLHSPDQLWSAIQQGRGFIDIDANALPGDFQGRNGTITATSASIAYTVAGSQQGSQYLVPVAVFSGTANIEGVENPIPVEMSIEAVSAQTSPRG